MSSTDNLREAVQWKLIEGWADDDRCHSFEVSVAGVLAVLADPALRLAILDAMGLDATEGWIHKGDEMHTSVTMFCRRNMTRPADWRSVLVVRPKDGAS